MILILLYLSYVSCFNIIVINRRDLISSIVYKQLFNNYYINNPLIISCNNIGNRIAQDLHDMNIKVTATTTKPNRKSDLLNIVDNVVIIPQMEIGKDEIFKQAVLNSDTIFIADTCSIFSVHTFVRTCQRIANALINKKSFTKICLISSTNVYGCHTKGEIVNENSFINLCSENINNKNWKINSYANALALRNGENILLKLSESNNYIKTTILRPSGILNKKILIDMINYVSNKEISDIVGNSYMSLSHVNEISKASLWCLLNNYTGVYNIASESIKRKYFFDKVCDIMKKNKIIWTSSKNINEDYYYAIEKNPYLPNSQRYNMKIDCTKILKTGYKYYFPSLWNEIKL